VKTKKRGETDSEGAWSGAKAKAQGPQSGAGFCLSRSEAARREQAQRDREARSRREQRGWSGAPALFTL